MLKKNCQLFGLIDHLGILLTRTNQVCEKKGLTEIIIINITDKFYLIIWWLSWLFPNTSSGTSFSCIINPNVYKNHNTGWNVE